jgi:hypothetical protein
MKTFDRLMDWLEARPLWQICIGVILALVFLIAMSEVLS